MEITHQSIETYLKTISPSRINDIEKLVKLMQKVTQRKHKLWGSIIGFGKLYYRYPTGNDGHMPILALSNRKQSITLYLSLDIEKYQELNSLGKLTIGKSCLYIKKLEDIQWSILEKLVKHDYEDVLNYPFIKVIE
jgi:hypothetical protein